MPRGGKREGAGGKPKWNYGKTKTIRVPEALADQVLDLAQMLDRGQEVGELVTIETVTASNNKEIDLSGIPLVNASGTLAIKLEDLVLAGYKILPDRLSIMVEARLRKLSEIGRLPKNGLNKKS